MFEPSPPFQPFATDDSRFILLRAANRVGKTRHGTWLAAKKAIENPGFRIRFVGATVKQTNTVVGRYLSDFLGPYLHEKSYYTEGKGWNRADIMLANGSTIQLKSSEDKPVAHAGDEFHLVVFDEPPTPAIFTENVMRISSLKGAIWVLMTCVGRPVQWFRDMVEAGGVYQDGPSRWLAHDSDWVQYVAEYSAINCPWYDAEQVESHIKTARANPSEYNQRILGHWEGITVDRIFTGFTDRSVVNVDDMTIDGQPCIVCDWGEKIGSTFISLAMLDNKGRIVIIDEHKNKKKGTATYAAQAIVNMLERNGLNVGDPSIRWIGDVNVTQAQGEAGGYVGVKFNDLVRDEIAALTGVYIRFRVPAKFNGSVSHGRRRTNEELAAGRLLIDQGCKSVLQSLKHWQGTKQFNNKNNHDATLSHAADAVVYTVLEFTRR